MTAYAEVCVKSGAGKVIGTFRVDLPEKPIGDGNPETSDTRFVIDEQSGGMYGIGLGTVYLGVAAATGDVPEVNVRDAPTEPVAGPHFVMGDRVKVTGNNAKSRAGKHSIAIGTTVTIDGARDSDGDYWVITDDGYQQYVHEGDLRGVQVGDEVRIIGADHYPRHRLTVGTLATVNRVARDAVHVRGRAARSGELVGQFVSVHDFRLV